MVSAFYFDHFTGILYQFALLLINLFSSSYYSYNGNVLTAYSRIMYCKIFYFPCHPFL